MNDEPKAESKGVFIPRAIWEDESLTWLEKCLLAQIDAYSNDGAGGCYASNAYLAGHFNMSESSMANLISRLRKAGEIRDVSFNGRRRTIIAVRFTHLLREGSQIDEVRVHKSMNSHIESIKAENKADNKEVLLFSPIETKEEKLLAKTIPHYKQFTTPSRLELLQQDGFGEAWREYIADRKEKRNVITSRAAAKMLETMAIHPYRAADALQKLITKPYHGFEWKWFDETPRPSAYPPASKPKNSGGVSQEEMRAAYRKQ